MSIFSYPFQTNSQESEGPKLPGVMILPAGLSNTNTRMMYILKSRSSSVSEGTRLWNARPGFYSRQGKILIFATTSKSVALVPKQPPIQWITVSFLEIKKVGA
jgi:hypothetical protein